ncbi:hypothetical protein FACS1894122_04740 [Alphaproteobacteria bacterium]|nr:hypothetical protein FACS1894122_04740 [Alphaproteobacteria bacterium]
MGSELRKQELSLVDTLKAKPKQFSFEMASYVLEHGSKVSFGKETSISQSPFKTRSITSFHLRATEIEKISEIDGINTVFIERLAIAGLNAPLPTPYAELICMRRIEQDVAIAAFINAFNSRLLGISYQISKRRCLSLQNHKKNCPLTRVLATFLGDNPATMDRRLARLAYLFWTKEKSAAGLEAVITSYFNLETHVKQFRPFWCERHNIAHLGKHKLKLGENSMLGHKIPLSSFAIEIELSHKNYMYIYNMLTDKTHIAKLKFLIKKYLGDFFSCKLKLIPQYVPPLQFRNARLGKTAWLPSNKLDSAIVMCH